MVPDPYITIAGRKIGRGFPCFIVAELGTSHLGDLGRGFRLLEEAAKAGADCAKFQVVFADEIVHPKTGYVELPGGKTKLYDVFKGLEKNSGFYRALKEKTEDLGMLFLCTPFGDKSLQLVKELEVQAVKIASPELNHYPLLYAVAEWGVPVILSTGVSRLSDIENALGAITQKKAILHCVTAYPAPVEQYNLRLLRNLSALFALPAGVSDHSVDPILVPTLSVLAGGCIIEKHITLSHEGAGLDDPVALIPSDFARLVASVRELESTSPDISEQKLRRTYGDKMVDSVLGNGKKTLAPVESAIYRTTNRSILAIQPIKRGDKITRNNAALLRSEKELKPGLSSEFYSLVMGTTCKRDIPSGRGILWSDLL